MGTGSGTRHTETLAVFERTEYPCEPLTTVEVTEQLECTRRAAYDRLQRLVEEGELATKKVGARGRVWWRPSREVARPSRETTQPSRESDPVSSTILEDGRELEQYKAAVETVGDGVYIVDHESRFHLINQAYCDLTGYDRDEVIGAHASMVTTSQDLELAERRRDDLAEVGEGVTTVETTLLTKDGQEVPIETQFALLPLGDDKYGRAGVVRDIRDRKQREDELEARIRQQEAITHLGQLALETLDIDFVMAEASKVVADTLENDYCKVLDLDSANDELLLRQGFGWADGIVGHATVSAVEDDSQAAYTLQSSQPVVVENLDEEQRFSGPELLTSHGVLSGISTIIGPFDDPWGILGTHDTQQKRFTAHDVNFVQTVAHILTAAINRHEFEHELERRRQQLAALNDLNDVIHGVTDAVIAQSTRDEVEQVVCDRFADTETNQFAWIGELTRSLDSVRIKATSGCGEIAGMDLLIDDERQTGYGEMVAAALQTQSIQVRHIDGADGWMSNPEDDQHGTDELLYSLLDETGVRSTVCIPIVHEELIFGVLTISTNRANAFGDDERATITHLGELIGHSLASIERKRALMSEEVIELQFRMPDFGKTLGTSLELDGTISIDKTIDVGDGHYLAYGTVTDDGVDSLQKILDANPRWEELSIGESTLGERPFRIDLSKTPVSSVVAAQGGNVVESRIVDGTVYLRYHLPPGADVRTVTDAIQTEYPGTEMTARRQITRIEPDVEDTLTNELTDRQRAALEASFHAGFFEWPRANSGKDIAEMLGVSPSTFHQHLRTAEQKVFDSLLG
ncbi:bacterio-opsin activator domain-containing protein [Haloferax namakaokahaiae]|uniref:Bacterio-opsin activator domain-containing protein n=1 Tax=Haloferax namakaokahaiae TaxID=1748331 RepID=A0ABD5ZIS5_9EURY